MSWIPRAHLRSVVVALLSLAAAVVAVTCSQALGERCQQDSDCDSGLYCDKPPGAGDTTDGECCRKGDDCLTGGQGDGDADGDSDGDADGDGDGDIDADADGDGDGDGDADGDGDGDADGDAGPNPGLDAGVDSGIDAGPADGGPNN